MKSCLFTLVLVISVVCLRGGIFTHFLDHLGLVRFKKKQNSVLSSSTQTIIHAHHAGTAYMGYKGVHTETKHPV